MSVFIFIEYKSHRRFDAFTHRTKIPVLRTIDGLKICISSRTLGLCARQHAGCVASGFNGRYLAGVSIFAAGSNDVVDNIEHFKAPINLRWWPADACNLFRAVCDGTPCNISRIHDTRVSVLV